MNFVIMNVIFKSTGPGHLEREGRQVRKSQRNNIRFNDTAFRKASTDPPFSPIGNSYCGEFATSKVFVMTEAEWESRLLHQKVSKVRVHHQDRPLTTPSGETFEVSRLLVTRATRFRVARDMLWSPADQESRIKENVES